MPYVSFISAPGYRVSAPGCHAAVAGLATPLRTCPVDRVAPFLGLRPGQAPNARPPAPKLPQPRVDLVHVAPPTAIRGGCVGSSELERTALELERAALKVSQLVCQCVVWWK